MCPDAFLADENQTVLTRSFRGRGEIGYHHGMLTYTLLMRIGTQPCGPPQGIGRLGAAPCILPTFDSAAGGSSQDTVQTRVAKLEQTRVRARVRTIGW